jgi:ATPase subunit of ABC transporter with duplicated ATPase domains
VSIASGRRLGLISQIPVYPEGYTVEDVLKSAFSRMQRMEDEMNSLSQQMASGDESEETLRRYGELSAKFEAATTPRRPSTRLPTAFPSRRRCASACLTRSRAVKRRA